MLQNENSVFEMISQAQEYMQENEIDGWLLYDYRGIVGRHWLHIKCN